MSQVNGWKIKRRLRNLRCVIYRYRFEPPLQAREQMENLNFINFEHENLARRKVKGSFHESRREKVLINFEKSFNPNAVCEQIHQLEAVLEFSRKLQRMCFKLDAQQGMLAAKFIFAKKSYLTRPLQTQMETSINSPH